MTTRFTCIIKDLEIIRDPYFIIGFNNEVLLNFKLYLLFAIQIICICRKCTNVKDLTVP